MGKNPMSCLEVEAFALASSSFVENDSHAYVKSANGDVWENYGRSTDGILVAKNTVYKEWLMKFAPPGSAVECGLEFTVSGVCHTYANRELLIGKQDAHVGKAAKDEVCVMIFGKYGLGKKELLKRLKTSYDAAMETCSDPDHAYDTVIKRVENSAKDEIIAWKKVAVDYGKIPVDEIIAKMPYGAEEEIKSRYLELDCDREALFETYQKGQHSYSEFARLYKASLLSYIMSYLSFLEMCKLISRQNREFYTKNMQRLLDQIFKNASVQQTNLQQNGALLMNLANGREG